VEGVDAPGLTGRAPDTVLVTLPTVVVTVPTVVVAGPTVVVAGPTAVVALPTDPLTFARTGAFTRRTGLAPVAGADSRCDPR
jgi:hypothetical protein